MIPHSAQDSWFSIEKVSTHVRNTVRLDQTDPIENFGSSSSFGTLHAGGEEETITAGPQWFVKPFTAE